MVLMDVQSVNVSKTPVTKDVSMEIQRQIPMDKRYLVEMELTARVVLLDSSARLINWSVLPSVALVK